MANEQGVTLNALLGWPGPMTHRQFAMVQAWREEQWNKPSRTDHYLMLVALTAARILAEHPNLIQLENFKLAFERKGAKMSDEEKKRMMDYSKAAWMTRVGGKVDVYDANGNRIGGVGNDVQRGRPRPPEKVRRGGDRDKEDVQGRGRGRQRR